jgi:pimeloyl-ACP methyl ester carboxylesterase
VAFVLIPGAGGAAWYWGRVEQELRRRGHDAVAVDLPATDDAAGLAEYADAVVAAAAPFPGAVALVAQSMGGLTAALVCERRPVSLIVLVNGMIPSPGETGGEWWDNVGQAAAMRENDLREGRAPDAGFDPFTHFLHDLPGDVVDESAAHQGEQSGTPFAEAWPLDAWPDVPTRVLVGRDDRFFPAAFQRRIAEERLGITPDEMPGGHLVALARPAQVAERLVAYLLSDADHATTR